MIRDSLKRAGLSGPIEPALTWLGPKLIGPPAEESTVEVGDGIRLLLPGRFPSHRNFVVGSYERDLRAALRRFLRPGMAVADVGANIGYYTALFSRWVGAGGSVTAFEPDPLAHAYLERNVAGNGLTNVTVLQAAVAAGAGVESFVRNQVERGFLGTGDGHIEVTTLSLDGHFAAAGWPRVDLVKLDIEGGEIGALTGMGGLAQRNPELVAAVELNSHALRRAGVSSTDLRAALRGAGFNDAYVVEQGGRHIPLDAALPAGGAMYNLLVSRKPLPESLFHP